MDELKSNHTTKILWEVTARRNPNQSDEFLVHVMFDESTSFHLSQQISSLSNLNKSELSQHSWISSSPYCFDGVYPLALPSPFVCLGLKVGTQVNKVQTT